MKIKQTKTLKFFRLIRPFKKGLILVLLLSFISFLFELLSIGIFLPIINLIQNPEKINQINFVGNIFPNFSEADRFDLLLFSLLSIFILYFFKAGLNIFLSIHQAKLASKIDTYLSIKIYGSILTKPFESHSATNSSTYISTIVNEVHQFSELLKYSTTLVVEVFVSLGIFVFLLVYNPFSTLLIILFGLMFFLIMRKFTKTRLTFWGNQRQIFQDLMYKNLKNGFNSIIFINLKKIENHFIESFGASIKSRNIYTTRQYAFSNMPKQLLELGSILLLGLIVFFNIKISSISFENLILIFAFYVIAFSRILPSINRIITSYNFIVYSEVVIDKVYEASIGKWNQLKRPTNEKSKIQFEKSLELRNIYFKYQNTKKNILNNVNLKINKNDIVGISGDSGTGKTTLVNLLMGLLVPIEGQILIDGKIINDLTSFQNLISYVPQESLILDDSLINNIAFGQNNDKVDLNKIKYCIEASGLSDFLNSLDNGLETNLGEDGSKISGGQKQRIGLARALYFEPEVIFLDEATNALDKKTELEILKTIKKLAEKTTIIIISHDKKILEFCNNKFYLD